MPVAIEHAIVEFLTEFFQTINWLGVVIIMTIESANIPIPSEVTMPLAGWLLVEETGGTLFQAIWHGGLWGGLGCTIGSVLSYALGYYGGRPFLKRYGKYIMVHEKDLVKADKWFARWGDWAAFISRLLPIVRTFISFPAGIMKTRFTSFTILTFVGSFIWCAALAAGGWAFGSQWEKLRNVMRPFDIPIAIVILIGLCWYVWSHVKAAREDRASEEVAA